MQAFKAVANSIAEERMANVRTVKAFADEEGSSVSFTAANEDVY